MKLKKLKGKSAAEILDMFRVKARRLLYKNLPIDKQRDAFTTLGYLLNQSGIHMMHAGRRTVRHINKHITDNESDSFVVGLPQLHKKIAEILKRQKKEYEHYAYFGGYPYQSLGILGIYGERASEERFDSYNLGNIVSKDDTVLDIGCNCGFMSILTTYRTGAHCHGIDINPYMTDIGTECAKFLKIQDRLKLEALRFQDIGSETLYSIVYSFATHWTDDGNYRVGVKEHLLKIHSLLKPEGTLVFETHCSDVGDPVFYQIMDEMKEFYSWNGFKPTDNKLRELYIMKKK